MRLPKPQSPFDASIWFFAIATTFAFFFNLLTGQYESAWFALGLTYFSVSYAVARRSLERTRADLRETRTDLRLLRIAARQSLNAMDDQQMLLSTQNLIINADNKRNRTVANPSER